MNLYDSRAEGYPVPSAANSQPASQAPMPQQDPGFMAKLIDTLKRTRLPDSAQAAGRVQKKIRDTNEDISDRSRGTGQQVHLGGDTYAITPEQWNERINGTGPANAEWKVPVTTGDGDVAMAEVSPSGVPPKSKTPRDALKARAGGKKPEGGGREPAMVQDATSDALKSLINRFQNKDQELDLTPILSLTDAWTGSNFARAYDKPITADEREKMVIGLKSKLLEHQDNLVAKRDALRQRAIDKDEDQALRERGYENAIKIAQIGAGSRENVATIRTSGKPAQDPLKSPARRKAVTTLAVALHGNPEDQYDPKNKQAEMFVPGLSEMIAKKGEELEEKGVVPKGKGYDTALQHYVDQATAPKPEPE